MQEQLRQRLSDLRDEFAKGKARMDALEAEAGELRHTLLRISGAIQVLQEELDKADAVAPAAAAAEISAGNGRLRTTD
jgi:chromosome segregation ATPase